MTNARFYLSPPDWTDGELVLTGDEARHCAQVTRHRVGDVIGVFDGCGRLAMGSITTLAKDRVTVAVTEVRTRPAPVRPITLVQGIVKGDTMDWIIEKAVELGAHQVIPWVAQRSIVRLSETDAARKRDKWQRVALEACKQCGQTWLPQVLAPCGLDSLLAQTAPLGLKLATSLEEQALPLNRILASEPPGLTGGVALIVGPEGDCTPEEYQKLHTAGWKSWSLGALTLRSETAAICALSILSYELHTES